MKKKPTPTRKKPKANSVSLATIEVMLVVQVILTFCFLFIFCMQLDGVSIQLRDIKEGQAITRWDLGHRLESISRNTGTIEDNSYYIKWAVQDYVKAKK